MSSLSMLICLLLNKKLWDAFLAYVPVRSFQGLKTSGSHHSGARFHVVAYKGITIVNHAPSYHRQFVYTIPKGVVYCCYTHIIGKSYETSLPKRNGVDLNVLHENIMWV